jgi:hypothetical protein
MRVVWLFIQSFKNRLIVASENEVKLKSKNNENLNQNI